MDILVTVRAARGFDLVESFTAHLEMALGAGDHRMFTFQRVVGCRVFGYAKLGLFETLHGMTRLAGPAILAGAKLPLMRVFVAIGALIVRKGCGKIQAVVTGAAIHRGMLSLKGVLGLGVVKSAREFRGGNLLPSDC